MWDLIVSVPDHCLSFYFTKKSFSINCQARPGSSVECASACSIQTVAGSILQSGKAFLRGDWS